MKNPDQLSMLEFRALAAVARTPKYIEEISLDVDYAASSITQAIYRLKSKGLLDSMGERKNVIPQRFRKQFKATFKGRQLVTKTLKEIKESAE